MPDRSSETIVFDHIYGKVRRGDVVQQLREERDRYRQALVDIEGYEAWQGSPTPAMIAHAALGEEDR